MLCCLAAIQTILVAKFTCPVIATLTVTGPQLLTWCKKVRQSLLPHSTPFPSDHHSSMLEHLSSTLEPACRAFKNIDPIKPGKTLQTISSISSAAKQRRKKQRILGGDSGPPICCDYQKLLFLQMSYPEFLSDYCTTLYSSTTQGKCAMMPSLYHCALHLYHTGEKMSQTCRGELAHPLLSELVKMLSPFSITFCYFGEFLGEGSNLVPLSPFFLEAKIHFKLQYVNQNHS